MLATMRGTPVPTGKLFFAVVLALIAAPLAARADNGMVDVRTLPRLAGAVEDPARTQSDSLSYGVPTVVAVTREATRKLLAANGWAQYVRPMEESSSLLLFKKAGQGLYVSFTQGLGRPDQSAVQYTANRLMADVPLPERATEIVFDERRPYLGCIAPGTMEANLDFFRKELAASGWSPMSAENIAARWPKADASPLSGGPLFFSRENRGGGYQQPPIMLSLQPRGDGSTAVEVKVAAFALPADLAVARETVDLPEPDHTPNFGSTGSPDSVRRKVEGVTIAEIPVVLAFYRREMAARNWKEESSGAAIAPDKATLNFSSPEQTATLKLEHRYDLTVVSLVAQVKESALAARAKAKKEADDKFFSDAASMAKQLMAADAVRQKAQAANLSDAPLHALAGQTTPVPVPETAENIQFDGSEGKLEFDSSSSVKALASFYRGSLKSLGWREQSSVINKSNMAVLEFSKGGKGLSFTVMQMGPRVNVSADGDGLVMANAKADNDDRASAGSGSDATVKDLEPEPDSALPVPKQHTLSSLGVGKLPGTETAIRRDLDASIPADLGSVLAFYRGELGKRGWKESVERTVVKPDQAQLAFATPDGPATLKLGRSNGETSVALAQKIPSAAAQGDVLPKPGQSRLLFVNIGPAEAAVTINNKTVKIAAGAGGPQAKGPTLDLPPGKYRYTLKVAGGPVRSGTMELAADDTWGLMVSPAGEALPLQVY